MGYPLTHQIAMETPLRRWFSSRLGNADNVAGRLAGCRCLVPRSCPDSLPPWLIGAAFDWRLRLGLAVPVDPSSTSAFAGWLRVVRTLSSWEWACEGRRDQADQSGPVDALFVAAGLHGAGARCTDRCDEIALARIAVALALYEDCYRRGVGWSNPVVSAGPDPPVSTLMSLCPDLAAEELSDLVVAARHGLAPLFPATDIELEPGFTAHGIPADGELLIDGLLLELKTVTRPRVDVEWLWQLIGYVLLDGGRRGIDRVGLYLSRHALLLTWAVEDLVKRLGDGRTTVDRVRPEFLAAAQSAVTSGYVRGPSVVGGPAATSDTPWRAAESTCLWSN